MSAPLDLVRMHKLMGCLDGVCSLRLRPLYDGGEYLGKYELSHVVPAHTRSITFAGQDEPVYEKTYDRFTSMIRIDIPSKHDEYIKRLEEALAHRLRTHHDLAMPTHA